MKSLAPTPDGVLLVDKAEGMTSHDVVALVRRRLEIKKVGHCGTLDPIATGLLILTLGRGTKIQDLLMSEDKEYIGTLTLGTSTLDAGSRRRSHAGAAGPGAQRGADSRPPSKSIAAISTRCRRWSRPSNMTACRSTNSRARARWWSASRGSSTFIVIRINRIALPEIDFTVLCSKGFYVRTYAHDIGEELGCGAHLKALRRTKSGRFDLGTAPSPSKRSGTPGAKKSSVAC